MGIMLINASPRAPRSNSKQYARLFAEYCHASAEYYEVNKSNHAALCDKMEGFSDIVFVFPLYADGIPVTLLNFLRTLEGIDRPEKPTVSVIVNCGFIEPYQTDVAVEMVRCYCRQNGYPFGAALRIGSGEAILNTPFRMLLKAKMKRFAGSIGGGKYRDCQVTMPITKKMFIKASTKYWENYGKRNGITREQMETMQIE